VPPQPQFTHWSFVTPFALRRANQFRPRRPPSLSSDRYADALAEVESAGIANSQTATADEALTGQFWNGAIQNYWNEIAQTASEAHRMTTAESARLFALLNLSLADGVIAHTMRNTHNHWRPATAIRAADADGNPGRRPILAGCRKWAEPDVPLTRARGNQHAAAAGSAGLGSEEITWSSMSRRAMPGVVRSFWGVEAAERRR
jgi:hypothetical protein